MKALSLIALMGCIAALVSAAPASKSDSKITGDYLEARTASVFAGACHYGGEYLLNGRDAVMAWNFAAGSFNGVDLKGVRAAAAVTSDANLMELSAIKSEIIVDSTATAAQADAAVALLKSKIGDKLGQVVSVRRAPISFANGEKGYTVNVDGFAAMDVQRLADNACCAAPQMVWYSPLMQLENRKVGFTEKATFSGKITDNWERYGENSAFYGSFAF